MKKLFVLVLLLIAASATNAQVYTEVNPGQYAISTYDLGQTVEVEKATRRYWTYTGSGTLIADTVFYVASGEAMPTITGVPSNKWVAVLLEGGGVWNTTITVPRNKVIYAKYGSGADPVISGSVKITGWTQTPATNDNPAIYQASFTPGAGQGNISQLFVNGKKQTLARFPNSAYNTITTIIDTSRFAIKTITGDTIDHTGASVYLRTAAYFSEIKTVQTNTDSIIYVGTKPSQGAIIANTGCILMNKRSYLDAAGEWYYDAATDILYFWAEGSVDPDNFAEVRGSVIDNGIINTTKKDYITIKNLEIAHQKSTGITIETDAPSYIKIQNCKIDGQGGYGIFSRSGDNWTVDNNTITQQDNGGIYVTTTNSTISNNTVKNIGKFSTMGNYIYVNDAGNAIKIIGETNTKRNTIIYNNIDSINHIGIYLKGLGTTKYNYVRNTAMVKKDNGAIYLNGANSKFSIIRRNIIENVIAPTAGWWYKVKDGQGIYLDEYAESVKVDSNTVINAPQGGVVLHKPTKDTITDNTIFNTLVGLYYSGIDTVIEPEKTVFSRNLVITKDSAGYLTENGGIIRPLLFYHLTTSAPITSSYNKYVNAAIASDAVFSRNHQKIKVVHNQLFTDSTRVTWSGIGSSTINRKSQRLNVKLNPSAPSGQSGAKLDLKGILSTAAGTEYTVVFLVWKDATNTHTNFTIKIGGATDTVNVRTYARAISKTITSAAATTDFQIYSNNNTTNSGTIYIDNVSIIQSPNSYMDFSTFKSITGTSYASGNVGDINSVYLATKLQTGANPEIQRIFYNVTKFEITYSGSTATDENGAPVSSFTLKPFTSKYLKGTAANLNAFVIE
jgi:parallel beta-helix repeat protein